MSRSIFVARNVSRSRSQFYFLQRLQQLSIAVAQCNSFPATCFAMLCSISQSGSSLSSPRSSSVAVLRVAGSPIAQCNTQVFVQLQCYLTLSNEFFLVKPQKKHFLNMKNLSNIIQRCSFRSCKTVSIRYHSLQS